MFLSTQTNQNIVRFVNWSRTMLLLLRCKKTRALGGSSATSWRSTRKNSTQSTDEDYWRSTPI